jgi:hypothetical protein
MASILFNGVLAGFPEELNNFVCSLTGLVEYSVVVSLIPVCIMGISLATLSRSEICSELDMLDYVKLVGCKKTLSYSKPYALL